jgi:hypothetical protein
VIQITTFKSCCGSSGSLWKLDFTVSVEFQNFLVSNGFIENTVLKKANILHVNNDEFAISSSYGDNQLKISCKISSCIVATENLKALIESYAK